MFKAYKLIEDTEDYSIYEYRTVCVWIVYLLLGVIMAGAAMDIELLSTIGGILMAIYFVLVSLPSLRLRRLQKEAMSRGAIEVSGNKWSFKNPIRIKIPKHVSPD